MEITIDVDLARQAKLAENAILLERVVLNFAHFRLLTVNRDAAGGASSMPSAATENEGASPTRT
jgi:hypothetical protein